MGNLKNWNILLRKVFQYQRWAVWRGFLLCMYLGMSVNSYILRRSAWYWISYSVECKNSANWPHGRPYSGNNYVETFIKLMGLLESIKNTCHSRAGFSDFDQAIPQDGQNWKFAKKKFANFFLATLFVWNWRTGGRRYEYLWMGNLFLYMAIKHSCSSLS